MAIISKFIKRPLDDMSTGLQRLFQRFLRNTFNLLYIPGKDMKISDSLSWDPCSDVYNTEYLNSNLQVFTVVSISTENKIGQEWLSSS